MRKIAPQVGMSKSTVHHILKKRYFNAYKRVSTPQINDSYRQRRTERAGQLLQRFNDHSLLRLAFHAEEDFTVQVRTNHQHHT